MIEVTMPSASSHEIGGTSVASPLLSGSEPDDENADVIDHGSDTNGTVAISHKFSGHPCAAGCGHFCWAATGNPGGSDS
jgi:hypothetical protein